MNLDKIIDEFLSKKAIASSDEFTKKLFQKIEKENNADKLIDSFLTKEKIVANPNFTQKIMDKIYATRRFKIFSYGTSIVATAACLAFALFVTRTDKTLILANEFQEIENTMASLNEYEDEFNSFTPNFCDYDLNLYARVE